MRVRLRSLILIPVPRPADSRVVLDAVELYEGMVTRSLSSRALVPGRVVAGPPKGRVLWPRTTLEAEGRVSTIDTGVFSRAEVPSSEGRVLPEEAMSSVGRSPFWGETSPAFSVAGSFMSMPSAPPRGPANTPPLP